VKSSCRCGSACPVEGAKPRSKVRSPPDRSLTSIQVGLSLPYPLYYDEAERVLPDRPIGGLGLLQVGVGVRPIPLVPLVGAALASGDADLSFASLQHSPC
jgi:hypothetical protein